MASRTQPARQQVRSDDDHPDAQYALVAGLYAAALLAPFAVLAVSQVVADAAVLYVTFLLAVTGITGIAGWLVSHTAGLAVTFGRHDAVWLLVVVPFSWFGGAFGLGALGWHPPSLAVPLAMFGTAGGMFLGIVLVAMSRTRHADAMLERTSELVEWEARWPRRWRRIGGGVAIGAFTISAIGILAAFVFDSQWGWRLYYLLFVGVLSMHTVNPRTFRLTGAGPVIERPLQRRFRPWAAYAAYEITDDALIIRPSPWWQLAHRCDRTDIENENAAVEALEANLPER